MASGVVSGEAPDDDDILQEATLSASLMRILQSSSRDDMTDSDSKCKCQCGHTSSAHGGSGRNRGGKGWHHQQAVDSESETEKMEKWRAAGAALRKALMENTQVDNGSPSLRQQSDAMNAMFDGKAFSQNEGDQLPQKDYRRMIQDHAQKWHANSKDGDDQKANTGLLSVRERIKEITGHINNKSMKKTTGRSLKQAFRLSRSSRNPSQETASSESEEDADLNRHKFVPKCRRTSSASSSPRYQTGKKEEEEAEVANVPERMSQSAGATLHTNVLKIRDFDSIDTSENETDVIAKKLQELVKRHQEVYDSDPSEIGPVSHNGVSRLVSTSGLEAESMLNLADIESSMHSDEDGTLGESEGDVFTPARAAQRLLDLPGPAETAAKVQRLASALKSSCLDENGEVSDNGGISPYQYSDGDLDNLEINQSSDVEVKVKLKSKDLDSLPALNSTSSGASAGSEPDADADDEFECDCVVCQHKKTRTELPPVDQAEDHVDDMLLYSNHQEDGEQFSISLDQIAPLDLLMLREGRREVLELMFQNVIRQMLSVYPDLLSDQAPPPAARDIIRTLPVVRIISQSDEKMCPVCLCHFEAEEEACQLPCQHLFHSLCIQAWLNKSGTCPVCRHILKLES